MTTVIQGHLDKEQRKEITKMQYFTRYVSGRA